MRARTLITIVAALLFASAGCKQDTPEADAVSGERSLDSVELARATGGNIGTVGQIETVALLRGPMPTGIAVSPDNRLFVNFPRWGDRVEFTVAEIKSGRAVPYPNLAMNKAEGDPAKTFVSVQSVVVDPRGRLWALDTGSINFQPAKPGGQKMVCFDLARNELLKTISFPPDVAYPTTYLNDVRFDMNRGTEGTAFITDSSDAGPNGIIVVDLATGQSWRRLNDHPSTKAEPNFTPNVEGQPLMARVPGRPEAYLKIGSDGIAIGGDRLYYCPLAGRRLYSVSLDALADRQRDEKSVAQDVRDESDRGFASDGLENDPEGGGRIYLTDYEHNAIRRRSTDGTRYEILAQDPRMLWPDTLSLGPDGYLYFTANQLHRQKKFNTGKDLRQQPYPIFRVRVDASPRRAS